MRQKKVALTLTIPEPCQENYDGMTPVKGGRFCGACEKTIVDFRKLSDRQILKFYQRHDGKICGVFNREQLNRSMPFALNNPPSQNWKAIAALASGLIFGGTGLFAQTTPVTNAEKVENIEQTTKIESQQKKKTNSERTIKGSVTEFEGKAPLAGATIHVKNTTIGTITDAEGNFTLIIPESLKTIELEVSYLGFESQTLFFTDKYPIPQESINIELGFNYDTMVMGIVIANPNNDATCATSNSEVKKEVIPVNESDLTAKNVSSGKAISIYPNPFITDLKVSYDFTQKGDYLFLIYDNKGQLVFAKSHHLTKGTQTVDLNVIDKNLSDGIYILQISDKKDRILASKKIFKGQA